MDTIFKQSVVTTFCFFYLLILQGCGGTNESQEAATKVRITFTADSNVIALFPVRILESVQIWPAKNETDVTHYNVYWGNFLKEKIKLGKNDRLAHIPAAKDGRVLGYEFWRCSSFRPPITRLMRPYFAQLIVFSQELLGNLSPTIDN